MADNSKIEWTDASWTPIRARNKATGKVGWHCEHVSPGCVNCYSERQNVAGFAGGTRVPFKPGHRADIELFLDEEMLTQPLRWKKPRVVFVCSMTDLFADFVPESWIDRVFAVMALSPQHTFIVLTKRAERMREYLTRPVQGPWAGRMHHIDDAGRLTDSTDAWRRVHDALVEALPTTPPQQLNLASQMQEPHGDGFMPRWPLPNVVLGVSGEDQERTDDRVTELLMTPAAVRIVSLEPLIELVKVSHMLGSVWIETKPVDAQGAAMPSTRRDATNYKGLDGVILGGESGPGARPMHPDWARSVRDQCAAAGVPFFFKQWGEYLPAVDREKDDPDWRFDYFIKYAERDGNRWLNLAGGRGLHGERFHVMRRVGKSAAGRRLDGREHNDLPWSLAK